MENFSAKKPFMKAEYFPVAWHICSSRAGKVKCPMNLTQKETPSNSQRIIRKNDLLWAAKLVICEERQELKHSGDLSAAAPARRRGKGPFPWVSDWMSGSQVSGSLQEAQAGQGVAVYPAGLRREHKQLRQGSRGSGMGREGTVQPWGQPGRESGTEHTKATQRSSVDKNIVFLQAVKPFMFRCLLCPGGD